MQPPAPFAPPSAGPGWYPDPAGSQTMRYWDGTRWTDALSSAVPAAGPHTARDDARAWAVAAHLSALLAAMVALAFLGPLAVYLVKKGDPFVRRHAAQALNFNLSVLLYGVVLGILLLALGLGGAPTGFGFAVIEILVLVAPLALAWFVLVCVGAARAGRGADFRYPLAIRFVR